ncbi:MAG: YbaN family protein [Rikenellaceae bacterium]
MKILFIIIGCLSLALGILGIFIPLLPTTPFVLLSAALFMRSSPRLHHWLLNTPHLGEYIRNYRENRAIPLRAKITSIVILWSTILYSVITIAEEQRWLQLFLIFIAIAVTWHILTLGTLPRKPKE